MKKETVKTLEVVRAIRLLERNGVGSVHIYEGKLEAEPELDASVSISDGTFYKMFKEYETIPSEHGTYNTLRAMVDGIEFTCIEY